MKQILIIEDNPMFVESSTQPLNDYYIVDFAPYVKNAIRMMEDATYDLIVIDIMMPTDGINCPNETETGVWFYKEYVRKHYPNQKILFWSYLDNEVYCELLAKYSIPKKDKHIAFLQKARSPMHLLYKVNELLNSNNK